MSPSQFANTDGSDNANPSAMLDEEKTMPIGVGDFSEEHPSLDPLAGANGAKKFNTGSLVIVLVVAVAVGGLWSMRKLTRVSAATGNNAEVEKTIEKFLSALTGSGSKTAEQSRSATTDTSVLDVLKETYTERQVALTDVQRNPFILYGETIVNTTSGSTEDASSAMIKQRNDRQAEFQRGAGELHLKSVIMGAEPLANISGKIVRVGDEIVANSANAAYRVSKITADAVTLVAEDKTLEVSVEVVLTIKRFN